MKGWEEQSVLSEVPDTQGMEVVCLTVAQEV